MPSEFTERLVVFFSKEQMEIIKTESEKLGLTASDWVRMTIFGGFVKYMEENWTFK